MAGPRYRGLWVLFVVLAVVAALVLALAGCGKKEESAQITYKGGPRISFDNRSLNFGTVETDKVFYAAFHVSNVGDRPLMIRGAVTKVLEGC